jgi:hypothetical protein
LFSFFVFSVNPASYQIRAGTLTYASGGSVHAIAEIIRHPDYGAIKIINDIAVWRVGKNFNHNFII